MRLFVAIDLSDDIRDYLFDLEKNLNHDAKIRWVAKKNLHLTLKFLGYMDDSRIDDVKKRLKEVKFRRFSVALNKLGWFPGGSNISVLWIDVKPGEEVIKLQKEVDSNLLDMFSSEQRFYSHLTLGRVKNIKNKQAFLKRLQNVDIKKIGFEVKEFSLIRSQLTRDGPKYNILERYKLN